MSNDRRLSARVPVIFFLLAVLVFLGLPAAYAEESGTDEDNWSFVLYNNNNGMPFSEANVVEQTQDGFIYVGSYGGLLRFDGEEFYRYDDIRLNNIMYLFADSRGRLWIATNSNGFCILEKGEFTFYGEEEGVENQFVRAFAEDENGNVLIGTVDGMYYMSTDDELLRLSDPHLDGSIISRLSSDGRNTIYGLTKNAEIFLIRDLSLEGWYDGGTMAGSPVNCIYADPVNEGFLYMGLEEGALLYGNPEDETSEFSRIAAPGLSYINSIRYTDGRLWVASDKGIAFYNEEGDYFRPDKMQRSESSQCIMPDMEGNIWIASDRLGVIKLSSSIFTNINSAADLPAMVVNTTFMKDGILYIGSDTGLICVDEEYKTVKTPVSDLLENERIRCIREDRSGCVWFCTYSDLGLLCLRPDGTIRTYTTADGFVSNNVREIYEMSDGTLAVSLKGGVYYIRDEEIVRSFEEDSGLINPQILAMCEYEEGSLLLGTNGDGIYVIENDKINPLSQSEQLTSDVILRINADPERSSWWITTGNSLCILHEDQITTLTDFPSLHNYDVTFDKKGNAWIFAGDGIYIGNADDMLAGKSVRYIHYDYKSGLPYIVTAHSRNYISPDGMFYMAGNEGTVRINMNQSVEHNSNIRLSVPYIVVDDETIYLSPGEKVTLPSRTKRIRVYPFALSYSPGDPLVSYGLEGFDEEMRVSSRSDLPSIIYTNLAGGTYTFRFSLLNSATGKVEQEVTVPIVKERAFYELALFWVLAFLAVMGIISFSVELYLKKKAREMEIEKEQDRMHTELSVAAEIQNSMLPRTFPAFPERTEFELYASMDPAKEVAGDFYDYYLIDEDHLALVMADVSGKGVGAALFMVVAKNTLKSSAMSGRFCGPGKILEDVNNKLCEGNDALMFVTVWLGILTISTGELVTANAGHEYPVFYRDDRRSFEMVKDRHGPALGVMEGLRYKEEQWKLNPGDGLFVYTDGIPEATNEREELFGNGRMLTALNQCVGRKPEEILKNVRRQVDIFAAQAPQFDDVTMLAMKYYGSDTDSMEE